MSEAGTGGAKSVLIVDDAVTIRAYLERLLRDDGFEVTTAVNGADGLEKAMMLEPDVIICDLNMPQMTGIEMVRALRENAEVGQTPVTMLSSEGDTHDLAQAEAAGANYYMKKPPQPEQVRMVSRLMSGRAPA
ncbi:MAG: response regulator [Pseudomonadota bacterium]